VRPEWSVLLELASELTGTPLSLLNEPMVTRALTMSVPFYAGIALDEIGGRGVRWQERDAASKLPEAALPDAPLETPPEPVEGMRLGTVRSLWSGRETRHAPVLAFLTPTQRAELSAEDADRLGIQPGDEVEVAVNGTSVRAVAALRSAVPAGSVFLVEGTAEENATALLNGQPRAVEVRKA
jgi:NADH-quinone oxidoreductase subunit G